ncbi:hypothetical protein K445DRAFT_112565 [Daldinia sp. EC12]|nr:hypothetical protein K445DRAFT_112565 [Daldinia sp. EC12]
MVMFTNLYLFFFSTVFIQTWIYVGICTINILLMGRRHSGAISGLTFAAPLRRGNSCQESCPYSTLAVSLFKTSVRLLPTYICRRLSPQTPSTP